MFRADTRSIAILFASLLPLSCSTFAQTAMNALPDAPQAQVSDKDAPTIRNLPRNVLHDQPGIWTSPLHIRKDDLVWLLPLGAASGVAIATDRRVLRDIVSHDPSLNNDSTNASNVAVGSMLAVPAVLYGYGHFHADDHARETGLLGAEAIVDGVVVEQGMKLIFWRERPYMDQGRGKFFQSSVGIDSSFPSSHAVLAFATASVIAQEYPRPLTQFAIYAAATGVSLTRLMGQQHFPSDLLVGSAAGWLVGRYVYHHHHRHHAIQ
jgi:hypothetical protein